MNKIYYENPFSNLNTKNRHKGQGNNDSQETYCKSNEAQFYI